MSPLARKELLKYLATWLISIFLQVVSLQEDAASHDHINKELKDTLNSTTVELRDKEAELATVQSELASLRAQLENQLKQVEDLTAAKVNI